MKRMTFIIIILLMVDACSLLVGGRDPDEITQWLDEKPIGSRYKYYIQYDFENDEYDRTGFFYMTLESIDYRDTSDILDKRTYYHYEDSMCLYRGEERVVNNKFPSDIIIEFSLSYISWDGIVMARVPVEVGSRYWDDNFYKYEVSAVNTAKQVKAGRLTGLVVETMKYCGDTIYEAWYSPSLGIPVKFFTVNENVDPKLIIELESIF